LSACGGDFFVPKRGNARVYRGKRRTYSKYRPDASRPRGLAGNGLAGPPLKYHSLRQLIQPTQIHHKNLSIEQKKAGCSATACSNL
jgi:hypothetical protein